MKENRWVGHVARKGVGEIHRGFWRGRTRR
jgi:hypothetical protein